MSPFRTVLVVLASVVLGVGALQPASMRAADEIPLTIDNVRLGAPITIGIPFPQGELQSPEHVRLLTPGGEEIPSQITPVTTWAPADSSLKWIWVFFFAEEEDRYRLEYGPDVQRTRVTGDRIRFVNDQRSYGSTELTTGPLYLEVDKKSGGGFLDEVRFDKDGDGFEKSDLVATGPTGRGSYLDLLDRVGLDSSRATITQTFKEKGSGPLHAILRIEGTYRYSREDNNPAPFVTRIHAYAGKPYIRVLHTITYTGEPDQHPPIDGQHAQIATSAENIVDEDSLAGDPRWTQPNDQIAGAGLALDYNFSGVPTIRTAYRENEWWADGRWQSYEEGAPTSGRFSVVQTGPDSSHTPPRPNSSATERIYGFSARIQTNGTTQVRATEAEGWIDIAGREWGVGIGMRHFMQEYPSELTLNVDSQRVKAFLWSRAADPMSFARWSSEKDGGMVDNFAQGLTKTTEFVYHFHDADADPEAVKRSLDYVLDPAVGHAPPSWYANSRVYGHMAPRSTSFASFERGMDYKFQWWRFNQKWEPWYGTFLYGDGKNYYFRNQWFEYANNEPAEDFMWWMHFMRTGDRASYLTAETMSRHTMDVDNTHWPADEKYRGDTNAAVDWWRTKMAASGSPYVGMGRRHGDQQWTSMLSAHVWTAGWLAAYYLSGYHRGLEVAEKTGAYYKRRIFGTHGLTGRRLYLSVWNLVELYDATKDPGIREELDERVDRMLRLQQKQGGSLIMDRYGYTQVYAARGLDKYYQITGDSAVRDALVAHARWVRDNPPLNHEMESYLSSISTLLVGYQYSKDRSLYRTAYDRAQALRTDSLALAINDTTTQAEFAEALEGVDRLPRSRDHPDRRPIWSITNGLRIFGWTHAYNVPYLVYWLEREGPPSLPADSHSTAN